ncbi:tRNA-specific adenosine deaminase subunit tad3 [Curvularia clavata]|uniref:tRNA-specific adenosine deaminase subunit tad3 n=1 Tax=Curvularia clavata TaxID=95742 RepID=A0A9Q9DWQ2_CURCL|nr:tRNA-specific adenosine deaminase subunit tad3 [Curvularia clavata]
MSTLRPLSGRLVPLRTKEEVRASLETHTVYVAEVPSKHTNPIKDALHAALPDFKTAEISHLRRVCQLRFLPEHLQQEYRPPSRLPKGSEDNNEFGSIYLSSSPASASSSPNASAAPVEQGSEDDINYLDTVRFFVLCPTRFLTQPELRDILRKIEPYNDGTVALPRIFQVTVPALAPISAEQADEWSNQYWPIAYKNTNPYGPHPSLVQRNQSEIQLGAGEFLALAKMVGQKTSDEGLGENVGVVIVDQTKTNSDVVVVAGDCRWESCTEPHTGTGNVMAHAALRAIAMVGKKRLRAGDKDPENLDRPFFCDNPITSLEKEYFSKDNINASGYLCVDLDIYLTHEPCVMCSMAILHSRFRRCVFGKRMPHTGGMTSDDSSESSPAVPGLKNGLFWRPNKLNWKLLTWEFKEEDKATDARTGMKDTLHA